jgi:hypothetical protein
MKNIKHLLPLVAIIVALSSCKMLGRTAAKYWTKKQIKEFVTNCENNASKLLGEDKAKDYCDCAVDVVAEQYQNYDDVKQVSIREILRVAKECK